MRQLRPLIVATVVMASLLTAGCASASPESASAATAGLTVPESLPAGIDYFLVEPPFGYIVLQSTGPFRAGSVFSLPAETCKGADRINWGVYTIEATEAAPPPSLYDAFGPSFSEVGVRRLSDAVLTVTIPRAARPGTWIVDGACLNDDGRSWDIFEADVEITIG